MDNEKTQKNALENFMYICEGCSYCSNSRGDYKRHCSTKKHILDNEKTQKNAQKTQMYICDGCSFSTNNKTDYMRHCLSKKHQMDNNKTQKTPKATLPKYECECGKMYKYKPGLLKHKKTCSDIQKQSQNDASSNTLVSCDLIVGLFKEMMKGQNEQMLELIGKGLGNTTTNTNSHNVTNKNRFNLNFFLNEQCKDAMNIMDFVNTIQLQLSDLERVGELGYVKGISHIVVNKLKDMDIHKRPIHCSDLKRETMYVKDEDVWEKENANKDKLSKMITHVAHKNQKQINEWQEENPEYKDSESTTCEKYLKIVGESMSGLTNDHESEGYTNKIIKNIAKEVTIKEE